MKPLAKVGVGVAVAQNAPSPDIGSVEGLRRTLLAARAVAYIDPASGGTSGIYVAKMFERLGIAAEMKPKSVLVRGGLSAEKVANGEAEIALQQASELYLVPSSGSPACCRPRCRTGRSMPARSAPRRRAGRPRSS
jgi:molybdate transport system substrate-binding protein